MVTLMQKVISSCEWCFQHKGNHAKAPMQPIIATASLELLHVDFTSIEMTMELDQPQNVVSILVFCDHFTKHVMAYVTPTKLWRLLLSFYGKDTSQSLEHLPSSWVTEEQISKATSSKSCVSSWAYGRFGLHLTMLKPMDKLSELTKHWCTW